MWSYVMIIKLSKSEWLWGFVLFVNIHNMWFIKPKDGCPISTVFQLILGVYIGLLSYTFFQKENLSAIIYIQQRRMILCYLVKPVLNKTINYGHTL